MDAEGFIYIFCNSHGTGYEVSKDDPTRGKSYIYRSIRPHSIDAFLPVREDNFSYSQPWWVPDQGMLWLHTRYQGNHRWIHFSTTRDGGKWSEPQPLIRLGLGSYQISWAQGNIVATAMDYHPEPVGLNARTNIYYIQTNDLGRTWRSAAGAEVELPLKEVKNPALVHDFHAEGLLVYLKDLAFDRDGRPVMLYMTSKGYKSGPSAGPRQWETIRWTGNDWQRRSCVPGDHNYDHGSLYIEPDGLWRIIAPTEPGPQPHGTGGQIAMHISRDQGSTWWKMKTFPVESGRNHTYVRKPLHAHETFYAFWADGNAFAPSDSELYFCSKDGNVRRLPRVMTHDDFAFED